MVTVHRDAGWKIAIYGREHGLPHFHVEGPDFRCSIGIGTQGFIIGTAPPVSAGERLRTIAAVRAKAPAILAVRWSDGTRADVDLSAALRGKGLRALRRAGAFGRARVGEWGHSVVWPSGAELGADALWLETLSATGHGDTRAFLEWRLRHGLSLTKAAEELGLSRRMVAYYSSGTKPVPRPILLACTGWEASRAA